MPIILIIIALTGLLLTSLPRPIQSQQILRQREETKFPGVFIQDSTGTARPLHIQVLNVDVQIRGTLATTTMEMQVYNPHNRILEGEFSFPVADGQVVSRFALDINGKMREAVVVDKAKGRETFEEVIRTKVDPALLEWTRDNSFRARIYPINPRSTRRIIVAYEQQLSRTDDGFGYTIPFAFPEKIDSFMFHTDVAAFGSRPSLAGDGGEQIQFTHRGRSFIADINERDILVDKPFTLSVPVVLRSNIVTVNTFNNEQYFGAFLVLPTTTQPSILPNRITLSFDASLSGARRNHDKEQQFLDAFFKRIQNVSVEFMSFANEVLDRRSFVIRDGNWSELRSVIESITYDGGTQLGIVPLFDEGSDYTLLLSDGISTFGKHEPSMGSTPIFTVSSGAQADHDVLRYIADKSGGKYIDLTSVGMDDAIISMFNERPTISSIEVIDGEIDDMRPEGRIEVGEVTTITGRLKSQTATIAITTSIGGTIADREILSISTLEHSDSGSSMARLWAQEELRRLSRNRIHNEEAIKTLGMKFGIVTPGTSLIVLERIQDYIRFGIEPPSSEPEMVAQWTSQRRYRQDDSIQALNRHHEYVGSLIKQRNDFLSRTIDPDSIYRKYQSEKDLLKSERGKIGEFLGSSAGPNAQGQALRPRPRTVGKGTGGELMLASPDVAVQDQYSTVDEFTMPDSAAGSSIRIESSRSEREVWTATLEKTSTKQLYSTYLKLRPNYEQSTSFYLDFSDRLREKGLTKQALQVLSCLAELHGEDPRDLRILGHRLLQLKMPKLAVYVFKDIMRIRSEEPQAYRDLALAYVAEGNYQHASDLFVRLIEKPWHTRFPEIELIALTELNRLIVEHGSEINTRNIKKEYIFPVKSDVRVVLTWDADNCDIDLWVTDPLGEVCKYNFRDTRIGGHMSRDFTGGYGPEEFILPKALKGEYKIQVHYYGDRQQSLARSTTIQVDLFRNYAKRNEHRDGVTMRLDGVARIIDVGRITVN